MCAVVGAFIGFALGWVAMVVGLGYGMTSMAMAVGGAVAGVISGKRLHVALAAIGGGVLGTIALAIILIIEWRLDMDGPHLWISAGNDRRRACRRSDRKEAKRGLTRARSDYEQPSTYSTSGTRPA